MEYPTGEDLIWREFGTDNLPIVEFPNLVFRANPAALKIVLELTGGTGGIWGEPVPFGPDGSFYESEGWPLVEEFELWRLPKNQAYLLEEGWGRVTTSNLTMVIDANVDRRVLRELAQQSRWDAHSDWEADYLKVAKFVACLEWIYTPLPFGELDLVHFVASKERGRLIVDLEIGLKKNRIKSARLDWNSTKAVWAGSTLLV